MLSLSSINCSNKSGPFCCHSTLPPHTHLHYETPSWCYLCIPLPSGTWWPQSPSVLKCLPSASRTPLCSGPPGTPVGRKYWFNHFNGLFYTQSVLTKGKGFLIMTLNFVLQDSPTSTTYSWVANLITGPLWRLNKNLLPRPLSHQGGTLHMANLIPEWHKSCTWHLQCATPLLCERFHIFPDVCFHGGVKMALWLLTKNKEKVSLLNKKQRGGQ